MPGHPGAFVAVGTALTGGPPHRSQRAGLPHWAPRSGPTPRAGLYRGRSATELPRVPHGSCDTPPRLCVRCVRRRQHSPHATPFPPPSPHTRPQPEPCSTASPVLRGRPTSHHRASRAYDLSLPRATLPPGGAQGSDGISRFSRMKVPYMPWFSDRAGPTGDSRYRHRQCCLPRLGPCGHPEEVISRLNSPACTYPYRRFATPSRVVDARLGAVVGRYSFDVEHSQLLLHTGFIPALTSR